MVTVSRRIVESERTERTASSELLNTSTTVKKDNVSVSVSKKRHHSKNWYIKHKLRQINYEKALRAYIGYLACNVSENSSFGRAKLIQFYKEKRPVPFFHKPSTVDTSTVQLKTDKMSYDEYRRLNGPATKFSEYMKYYRS